ncbi:hypothetical protein KIMC2_02330 [Xylocopilactobacillus apis]|uniref:Uncharacterized protein n=1 Tax=Xylocopilactobacillus apis TaxID=2932183 RepID=A0AAU9CTK6_9LACO|nr:hypothetical protein KIMC2_02330 [Xylocopilactobacillus apis]
MIEGDINEKKIKKILITIMIFQGFVTTTFVETTNVEASTIAPRRPVTEWRYKVKNGYLYKRLYDTTNQRWIGKWRRA